VGPQERENLAQRGAVDRQHLTGHQIDGPAFARYLAVGEATDEFAAAVGQIRGRGLRALVEVVTEQFPASVVARALPNRFNEPGLMFVVLNADIERQFEFVQNEWMKGGEFIGLDPEEQDPINGVGGEGSLLSVPGAKRPFVFDLPTFVTVKGGEYLFVPGLNALDGLIEQRF